MLGRIHIEQLAQDCLVGLGHPRLVHRYEKALDALEQPGWRETLTDIGVPRERPKGVNVGTLIIVDGRLAPQQGPLLVRIAALHIQVGINDVDRIQR